MRWNYERKDEKAFPMEQDIDERFNRFVDIRLAWSSGLFTKP